METRRVEANGIDVELLEAGAGGRPLLLVHGFTGAKEDFADHADRLAADGWHVVAPDLRGHGGSGHPEGEDAYSLRTFAADLVALVETLGWPRFTLLGHSMGGMVAQVVAIDHADRLDALVLMDTSHAAPDDIDPDEVELGKQVVREGGMALLVEVQRGREGSLSTPADTRVRATRPGYVEFDEGKKLASSPDMWLAMISELLDQADRLAALAELDLPTLVIVGDQDGPFLAHARRMADRMPRAELAVIADAGHSPQFENPDAWLPVLTGFLDRVASGGVRVGDR